MYHQHNCLLILYVQNTLNAATVTSNIDSPENGLEALAQVTVCLMNVLEGERGLTLEKFEYVHVQTRKEYACKA